MWNNVFYGKNIENAFIVCCIVILNPFNCFSLSTEISVNLCHHKIKLNGGMTLFFVGRHYFRFITVDFHRLSMWKVYLWTNSLHSRKATGAPLFKEIKVGARLLSCFVMNLIIPSWRIMLLIASCCVGITWYFVAVEWS